MMNKKFVAGGQRAPQIPARPRTPRRPYPTDVIVCVWQRLLALKPAIWHNDHIGADTRRVTAYDHCPLESTI